MLQSETHGEGGRTRTHAHALYSGCATTVQVPAKLEISAIGARRPFLLVSGWAFQQHIARDGERQILGLMLPGEAFLGRTGHSIAAATQCVVEFPAASTWDLFRDAHPAVAGGIDDLQTVQRWLIAIGRNEASKRVAFFLCNLSQRLANGEGEALLAFDLPITQHDIADMCCVTAVHVNRVIRRMENSGLIEREQRKLIIKDYHLLMRLASFL